MNAMTTVAYSYVYSSNPRIQDAFKRRLEETSLKLKEAYATEEANRHKCKIISEKEAFEIHLEQIKNPIVFKK